MEDNIMPDNVASKITDSELEVMKLLWRAKDALPVTAIREELQSSKGWEPATIKTLISRLVSKRRCAPGKTECLLLFPRHLGEGIQFVGY